MKPFRVLTLTLLLTTTALSQDSFKLQGASALGNCPVGMNIDRDGLYAKREVGGSPATSGNPQVEQRIRLDLTNRKSQQITGAEVTVHGLSQKVRFVEVSGAQPDLAKVIELSLDLKGKGQSSNVLWLTRFAVVSRVDLKAVTYADGSSWHEPFPGACSAAPSSLVQLGAESLTR